MLAQVVRNGVVEAEHLGAVAVVSVGGEVLYSYGDVDRVFFSRSAAKPFQATVSQESGAGLDPVRLAVACASHGGQAAHVAIVRSMLTEVGLSEEDLQNPPDWPLDRGAARRRAAEGYREPQRVFHNCSGKHAAMLRACRASGWDTETYRSMDHPLQRANAELIGEVTGGVVGGVGVDGCGVPVFGVTALTLARAYARLAEDERLASVWNAMHAYPHLTSWTGFRPAALATRGELAAKGGAEGCAGYAVRGRFGLAIKSWDGQNRGMDVAAAAVLARLGVIPAHARDEWLMEPPVLGGGSPVGSVRVAADLT